MSREGFAGDLSTALLAVVIIVLLGGLVCLLGEWITAGIVALYYRWRPSKEGPEEYAARLRSPRFDVLEVRFGGPVPDSLKRLYRNQELLAQVDFRLIDPIDAHTDPGHSIAWFLPADRKARDEVLWELGESLFPFAQDGFGNYYCVRIQGDPQGPCSVYFWDHEVPSTLEEMKIADSLDEFLARQRSPILWDSSSSSPPRAGEGPGERSD
jgi:hypothetical protein